MWGRTRRGDVGVQPKKANAKLQPANCKGKVHQEFHLGSVGAHRYDPADVRPTGRVGRGATL